MSAGFVKASLRGVRPYAPPVRDATGELLLDLNEGAPLAPDDWIAGVARTVSADRLRRYPDASGLEARLAERLGVDRGRVLVTNGGDDAIDRICKVCLGAGDSMVLPSPSFEMIARSAELAGGVVRRVPWMQGSFPIDAVAGSCEARTRLVAAVSPNNPTGAVITAEQLRKLSAALPDVLLMVDLAYTEFAEVDLTPVALSLPNAVIVRTFSKAYGLAGLRLGYAVGSPEVIDAMRAAGGPFPCSAVSVAAGDAALDMPVAQLEARLAEVRRERSALTAVLLERGAAVLPSEANFVFARFDDAAGVWRSMGEQGVRVKRFADPALAAYLRIGLPGEAKDYERLVAAIGRATARVGGAS